VSGNCDSPQWAPRVREVERLGWRVLVVHGDRFGVHLGHQGLLDEAHRRDAQLVCYGHTHHALHAVDEGVHLLNPGSLARGERRGSFARVVLRRGADAPEIQIVEVP